MSLIAFSRNFSTGSSKRLSSGWHNECSNSATVASGRFCVKAFDSVSRPSPRTLLSSAAVCCTARANRRSSATAVSGGAGGVAGSSSLAWTTGAGGSQRFGGRFFLAFLATAFFLRMRSQALSRAPDSPAWSSAQAASAMVLGVLTGRCCPPRRGQPQTTCCDAPCVPAPSGTLLAARGQPWLRSSLEN